MTSKAGNGFVSVGVDSFARNLLIGFYSKSHSRKELNVDDHYWKSNSSNAPRWMDVVCDDMCISNDRCLYPDICEHCSCCLS